MKRLLALSLFIAACAGPAADAPLAESVDAVASDLVYLQIVAHQDDDFLFMNPDLKTQIEFGFGTVTIFMTAGEANGASPECSECWESIARDRQNGIRAAYAEMAGVADLWSPYIYQPDGTHWIELYTLIEAPQVRLIFMNLPDAADERPGCHYALANLFADPSFLAPTIVPAGSGLPEVQLYDRSGVVSVLSALIEELQPIHVRTLDPEPFQISSGDTWIVSFDNSDHTHAARFADEVLASYTGPYETARWSLVHYKGYSFADYPQNLGYENSTEKRETAMVYLPHDANYELYANSYESWYGVMYERDPGSTKWVERMQNGRLAAFAVENRQVMMWSENSAGGAWTGPVSLSSPGAVAPHLALVKRSTGLRLFALRVDAGHEMEVITAQQNARTRAFGAWTSLGNPQPGQRFMGMPAAAIDGAGRTFVFVKGSDGRIYYKHDNGGVWSSWLAFNIPWYYFSTDGRLDIIDGIAAETRNDGRIEIFATSRAGYIQNHVQNANTTSFASNYNFPNSSAPITNSASAPSIAKNQDGRMEIFYRELDTGRVLTHYVNSSGAWVGPVVLYGDAGVGPVAAIRRGGTGHIMLFERNAWSGISATWQTGPNAAFYLQWQILGGHLNEYPAVATDNAGRTVLLVKGSDGRLYMQRETDAAVVGSFGGWTVIGD